MAFVERTEKWTSKTYHGMGQLARLSDYYVTCDSCGTKYHTDSKWERFCHWLTCNGYNMFSETKKGKK